MRYVIQDEEVEKKEIIRKEETDAQLVEGFDPVGDLYDRRILFELTKRRVEEEDF